MMTTSEWDDDDEKEDDTTNMFKAVSLLLREFVAFLRHLALFLCRRDFFHHFLLLDVKTIGWMMCVSYVILVSATRLHQISLCCLVCLLLFLNMIKTMYSSVNWSLKQGRVRASDTWSSSRVVDEWKHNKKNTRRIQNSVIWIREWSVYHHHYYVRPHHHRASMNRQLIMTMDIQHIHLMTLTNHRNWSFRMYHLINNIIIIIRKNMFRQYID